AHPDRGGQDGTHGVDGDVEVVGAVPGEDGELFQARECGTQRGAVHPAAGAGEVGPAQALGVLAAEGQVDAAAEGVPVDEEWGAAHVHGGEGEGGGGDGRAGAAAAADHADDVAGVTG